MPTPDGDLELPETRATSARVDFTAVHAPRQSTFEGEAPSFAQEGRDAQADEGQDTRRTDLVLGVGGANPRAAQDAPPLSESDPGSRMTLGGDDAGDENARTCQEQV